MPRFIESLVSSLYSAAVLFVYVYISLTVLNWPSLQFGFHPPTDVSFLVSLFVTILAGVIFVAVGKAVLFEAEDENVTRVQQPHPSTYYAPAQRKLI